MSVILFVTHCALFPIPIKEDLGFVIVDQFENKTFELKESIQQLFKQEADSLHTLLSTDQAKQILDRNIVGQISSQVNKSRNELEVVKVHVQYTQNIVQGIEKKQLAIQNQTEKLSKSIFRILRNQRQHERVIVNVQTVVAQIYNLLAAHAEALAHSVGEITSELLTIKRSLRTD